MVLGVQNFLSVSPWMHHCPCGGVAADSETLQRSETSHHVQWASEANPRGQGGCPKQPSAPHSRINVR